ncbi:MAG: hypothetical protein B7Z80_02250 [Rhodospirillales bacterium 20-64-7]|nr:MAG: hypothetical protein B7Z80_02250 [Rhodospirillales bacterium 20-64-7]
MKPRTLARLDLLAATSETQIRNEIVRLTSNITQIAQQRVVLATYGARLNQSWREGGVVVAATAQLAGYFANASYNADTQISAMEQQVRAQLNAALQNLETVQERRRNLKQSARNANQIVDAEAERRQDRDLTSQYHGKPRLSQ